MGVKVGLHDDCDDLTLRGHHVVQVTATYPDVDTLLADDVQPTTETTVNPTLTVKQRVRTGYDDDGTPMFDWTTVVEGPAIVWVMRQEFDADAGLTAVKGTATVLYEGPMVVTESAVVEISDDERYRVSQVAQVSGALHFVLERIDGGG